MSGLASVFRWLRRLLAFVVWSGCALAALTLAAGAVVVALQISREYVSVEWLLRAADTVDLGVFSRADGVAQFRGRGADVKNAMANWGLAALVWLTIGQVLDRVIGPRPVPRDPFAEFEP